MTVDKIPPKKITGRQRRNVAPPGPPPRRQIRSNNNRVSPPKAPTSSSQFGKAFNYVTYLISNQSKKSTCRFTRKLFLDEFYLIEWFDFWWHQAETTPLVAGYRFVFWLELGASPVSSSSRLTAAFSPPSLFHPISNRSSTLFTIFPRFSVYKFSSTRILPYIKHTRWYI